MSSASEASLMQRNANLQAALEEAKLVIAEQQEWINMVKAMPSKVGCVAVIDKKLQEIAIAGNEGIIQYPLTSKMDFTPGQPVSVLPTGEIVGVSIVSCDHILATFRRRVGKVHAEVSIDGRTSLVFAAHLGEVEEGDTLTIDRTGSVAIQNLGQQKRFIAEAATVSWDDIGGCHAAKQALIEAVELPRKNAELLAKYGQKPAKGVLLYGPPGNGKTMLAKALSKALSDEPGGFISVKGPEVLDPYVGVAEATIRSIFAQARTFKAKSGQAAVVFIDEAEAILAHRGSGRSSDMEKTIVPSFLTEMDGLEESAAIVILATNRPDMLDVAVTREGRIDRKVMVGRPDQDAAKCILKHNIKQAPLANNKDAGELVNSTITRLYCESLKVGVKPMSEYVSGAMVAAIGQRAIASAVRRDISQGRTTGLREDDLLEAVSGAHADQVQLTKEGGNKSYVRS